MPATEKLINTTAAPDDLVADWLEYAAGWTDPHVQSKSTPEQGRGTGYSHDTAVTFPSPPTSTDYDTTLAVAWVGGTGKPEPQMHPPHVKRMTDRAPTPAPTPALAHKCPFAEAFVQIAPIPDNVLSPLKHGDEAAVLSSQVEHELLCNSLTSDRTRETIINRLFARGQFKLQRQLGPDAVTKLSTVSLHAVEATLSDMLEVSCEVEGDDGNVTEPLEFLSSDDDDFVPVIRSTPDSAKLVRVQSKRKKYPELKINATIKKLNVGTVDQEIVPKLKKQRTTKTKATYAPKKGSAPANKK